VDRAELRRKLSLPSDGVSIIDGLSLSGGLRHDPAYDSIYNKALSAASGRVVRLSPDQADMNRQQKIALTKAGITNPAAWAAAGVTPSGAAFAPAPNGSPHTNTPTGSTEDAPTEVFDSRPPVVLMKGKNNPTFLISWRSQRDLARSLAWKCTAMIWGGPVLALLSLYALLTVTHLI
jgi:hypothetical protein